MKFDFSEKAILTHIENNYKSVINAFLTTPKLVSLSVEQLYANYVDGVVINGHGFDVVRGYIKDEVKYTNSIQGNSRLRVGGLKSKEGMSDNLVIIDGVNNRTFIIPTQIFFDNADLNHGANVEFRWSGSYNETDKNKIDNTNLLLKYEEV